MVGESSTMRRVGISDRHGIQRRDDDLSTPVTTFAGGGGSLEV
jgi:hypothetical protein